MLELKLVQVTQDVQSMPERFEAWKAKIVIDPEILGGEPVFPTSRLAVRHEWLHVHAIKDVSER